MTNPLDRNAQTQSAKNVNGDYEDDYMNEVEQDGDLVKQGERLLAELSAPAQSATTTSKSGTQQARTVATDTKPTTTTTKGVRKAPQAVPLKVNPAPERKSGLKDVKVLTPRMGGAGLAPQSEAPKLMDEDDEAPLLLQPVPQLITEPEEPENKIIEKFKDQFLSADSPDYFKKIKGFSDEYKKSGQNDEQKKKAFEEKFSHFKLSGVGDINLAQGEPEKSQNAKNREELVKFLYSSSKTKLSKKTKEEISVGKEVEKLRNLIDSASDFVTFEKGLKEYFADLERSKGIKIKNAIQEIKDANQLRYEEVEEDKQYRARLAVLVAKQSELNNSLNLTEDAKEDELESIENQIYAINRNQIKALVKRKSKLEVQLESNNKLTSKEAPAIERKIKKELESIANQIEEINNNQIVDLVIRQSELISNSALTEVEKQQKLESIKGQIHAINHDTQSQSQTPAILDKKSSDLLTKINKAKQDIEEEFSNKKTFQQWIDNFLKANEVNKDLPFGFYQHAFISNLDLLEAQLDSLSKKLSKAPISSYTSKDFSDLSQVFGINLHSSQANNYCATISENARNEFRNSLTDPVEVCRRQVVLLGKQPSLNLAFQNPAAQLYEFSSSDAKFIEAQRMRDPSSVTVTAENEKLQGDFKIILSRDQMIALNSIRKAIAAGKAGYGGQAKVRIGTGSGKTFLSEVIEAIYKSSGEVKEVVNIDLNSLEKERKKVFEAKDLRGQLVIFDEAYFYSKEFVLSKADLNGDEIEQEIAKRQEVIRNLSRELRKKGATVITLGASESLDKMEIEVLRIQGKLEKTKAEVVAHTAEIADLTGELKAIDEGNDALKEYSSNYSTRNKSGTVFGWSNASSEEKEGLKKSLENLVKALNVLYEKPKKDAEKELKAAQTELAKLQKEKEEKGDSFTKSQEETEAAKRVQEAQKILTERDAQYLAGKKKNDDFLAEAKSLINRDTKEAVNLANALIEEAARDGHLALSNSKPGENPLYKIDQVQKDVSAKLAKAEASLKLSKSTQAQFQEKLDNRIRQKDALQLKQDSAITRLAQATIISEGGSADVGEVVAKLTSRAGAKMVAGEKEQYIAPDLDFDSITQEQAAAIATARGATILVFPYQGKDANGEVQNLGCRVFANGVLSDKIKLSAIETHLEGKGVKYDKDNSKVISFYDKRNAVGGDYGALSVGMTRQTIDTTSTRLAANDILQYFGRERGSTKPNVVFHGLLTKENIRDTVEKNTATEGLVREMAYLMEKSISKGEQGKKKEENKAFYDNLIKKKKDAIAQAKKQREEAAEAEKQAIARAKKQREEAALAEAVAKERAKLEEETRLQKEAEAKVLAEQQAALAQKQEAQRKAEEEKRAAELAAKRAEEEKKAAELAARQAEAEKKAAEAREQRARQLAQQQMEQERLAKEKAEQEAQRQAQLAQEAAEEKERLEVLRQELERAAAAEKALQELRQKEAEAKKLLQQVEAEKQRLEEEKIEAAKAAAAAEAALKQAEKDREAAKDNKKQEIEAAIAKATADREAAEEKGRKAQEGIDGAQETIQNIKQEIDNVQIDKARLAQEAERIAAATAKVPEVKLPDDIIAQQKELQSLQRRTREQEEAIAKALEEHKATAMLAELEARQKFFAQKVEEENKIAQALVKQLEALQLQEADAQRKKSEADQKEQEAQTQLNEVDESNKAEREEKLAQAQQVVAAEEENLQQARRKTEELLQKLEQQKRSADSIAQVAKAEKEVIEKIAAAQNRLNENIASLASVNVDAKVAQANEALAQVGQLTVSLSEQGVEDFLQDEELKQKTLKAEEMTAEVEAAKLQEATLQQNQAQADEDLSATLNAAEELKEKNDKTLNVAGSGLTPEQQAASQQAALKAVVDQVVDTALNDAQQELERLNTQSQIILQTVSPGQQVQENDQLEEQNLRQQSENSQLPKTPQSILPKAPLGQQVQEDDQPEEQDLDQQSEDSQLQKTPPPSRSDTLIGELDLMARSAGVNSGKAAQLMALLQSLKKNLKNEDELRRELQGVGGKQLEEVQKEVEEVSENLLSQLDVAEGVRTLVTPQPENAAGQASALNAAPSIDSEQNQVAPAAVGSPVDLKNLGKDKEVAETAMETILKNQELIAKAGRLTPELINANPDAKNFFNQINEVLADEEKTLAEKAEEIRRLGTEAKDDVVELYGSIIAGTIDQLTLLNKEAENIIRNNRSREMFSLRAKALEGGMDGFFEDLQEGFLPFLESPGRCEGEEKLVNMDAARVFCQSLAKREDLNEEIKQVVNEELTKIMLSKAVELQKTMAPELEAAKASADKAEEAKAKAEEEDKLKAGQKPSDPSKPAQTPDASLDPCAVTPPSAPKKDNLDWLTPEVAKSGAITAGQTAVAVTLAVAVPGFGFLLALLFLGVTSMLRKDDKEEKLSKDEAWNRLPPDKKQEIINGVANLPDLKALAAQQAKEKAAAGVSGPDSDDKDEEVDTPAPVVPANAAPALPAELEAIDEAPDTEVNADVDLPEAQLQPVPSTDAAKVASPAETVPPVVGSNTGVVTTGTTDASVPLQPTPVIPPPPDNSPEPVAAMTLGTVVALDKARQEFIKEQNRDGEEQKNSTSSTPIPSRQSSGFTPSM